MKVPAPRTGVMNFKILLHYLEQVFVFHSIPLSSAQAPEPAGSRFAGEMCIRDSQNLFRKRDMLTVIIAAMELLLTRFKLDDDYPGLAPVTPVQQLIQKCRFPGIQKAGNNING